MIPRVRGIRSVEIDVASVKAASDFYRNVWKLTEVASPGATCFRGTAAYHHIIGLHPPGAEGPAIRSVVFDVADAAQLHALHAKVKAAIPNVEAPHALGGAAGGFGFGFKDSEARNFILLTEARDHGGASTPVADHPHKVTHINLNAADYARTADFLVEILGFRLIDESGRARFLHADCPDHFSVAVVNARNATLNHIAFDMLDIDSVMRGAGRMIDNGYPIEWGVGRHGPGNNVFAYFAGPEELPLEYTTEVLQIDDSYVPRGPDHWKFPPGRSDQWGITQPQTKRLARIQELFRFTADGHRT